jgi:hypothetical protein
MILPLNPPIPVETPRGKAQAIYLIEYGAEYDLYWITVLESSRECFTYNNRDIRAQISISFEKSGPETGKRSAA